MVPESFSTRVEKFLEKWMMPFAAVWLIGASIFTVFRMGLAISKVGWVDFLLTVKLSDAGDYVAGMIAVPAFIYLVRGFLTQQRELQASVTALNAQEEQMKAQAQALITQGQILARQLELAEAERLEATEPRLTGSLVMWAAGQQITTATMGHNQWHWLLKLQCQDHEMYKVAVTPVWLEDAAIPEVREADEIEAVRVSQEFYSVSIPRRDDMPRSLYFKISYRRKDRTKGEQTICVNENGWRRIVDPPEIGLSRARFS